MNIHQAIEAIIVIVQAIQYPGGEPVFAPDSVFASLAPESEVYNTYRMPLCVIGVGAFRADPEDPQYVQETIKIRLAQTALGDSRGTSALMGAHRVDGDEDSRGRGLLELQGNLMDSLALLNAAEGVNIQIRSGGAGQASVMDDGRYLAIRDYEFSADLTTLAS